MAELDIGKGDIVHALGALGYDLGTEARHDAFKQGMTATGIAAARPSDARAMVDYLAGRPYETPRLVWTLSAGTTPAYAIVAAGPFAREAYEALRQLLEAETHPADDPRRVERVGVSGRLTGETVGLLSGQVVPQVAIASPHNLYGWSAERLAEALAAAVKHDRPEADDAAVQKSARSFPERIVRDLYDLRNGGHSPQDRALNFAVTHMLQAISSFSEAAAAGLALASLGVQRSQVRRMNSDCWDAVLRFFDPDSAQQGQREYRFTVDVSDVIPVMLSPLRGGAPTGLIVPVPLPASGAAMTTSSAPAPAKTTPAPGTPAPGTNAPATPAPATDARPRIQLTGRGAESPDNLDATAYHFGTQTLGAPPRVRVFSLENNLDKPLNLDGKPRVALAGSGADQFEVVREPTSPVPPGGKTTFTIRFRPASAGLKTAELSIASDAPGRPPLVISLMGTAEAPPITAVCVTGELLDNGAHRFGAAPIGTRKAGAFTLENPGQKPLALKGGVVLDGQVEHFAITTPPPATVAAGGKATFAIAFSPRNAGAKLAMGRIDHDGEGSPTTFLLVGRADGVEIALKLGTTEIDTGGRHDFGETNPQKPTATVTFTIENQGAEPLLLTGDPAKVVIAGVDVADFSVQTQPTSPVLPGKSTPFTVAFAARSAGQKRAQVKIASNDPDENPYVVELTGLSRSLQASGGKRDRVTADEYNVLYCDKQGVVRYRNFNENGQWREVLALTNVKIVRGGHVGAYQYAVKTDGTVWRWTYSGGAALPPTQVPGIADVVALDAGLGHAVFVKADGTVWSIGDNTYGQLGNGSNTHSHSQVVRASNLSNAVAVAVGGYSSFALLNDGTVWSWGYNDSGMLANGHGSNTNVPGPILGLTRIVELCASKDTTYAMALRDDGVLWGWGNGDQGGLAQSSPVPRNFPVQITGIPKIKSILCIGRTWPSTNVLAQDGSIWSWGYDSNYRLGRNGNGPIPTVVSSHPSGIEAGCANQYCVVVWDGQGKSWVWGRTGSWGNTGPVQLSGVVLDG
jgi:hypothetical protein